LRRSDGCDPTAGHDERSSDSAGGKLGIRGHLSRSEIDSLLASFRQTEQFQEFRSALDMGRSAPPVADRLKFLPTNSVVAAVGPVVATDCLPKKGNHEFCVDNVETHDPHRFPRRRLPLSIPQLAQRGTWQTEHPSRRLRMCCAPRIRRRAQAWG